MMRYLRPLLDTLLAENRPARLLGVTLSHLVPQSERNKREQVRMPSLWE